MTDSSVELYWLKPGIALAVIGGIVFAAGLSAAVLMPYLLGLVAAALGLGLVIMVLASRFVRPHTLRWVITLGLPLLLIAAGALTPQLLIGRPSSRPLWQTVAEGADAALIGDRLYLHDQHHDQILDPVTGRAALTLPAEAHGLRVGADGSFVQYGSDRAVYRGPEGDERWSFSSAHSSKVLAIDDGIVVLSGCRSKDDICGIGPGGTISWVVEGRESRLWLGTVVSSDWHTSDASDAAPGFQPSVAKAPQVAVRSATKGSPQAEVYRSTGELITTIDERPIAIGGDLVITGQGSGESDADGTCRVAGYRGDQQVFRTEELACWEGNATFGAMLTDYFYLSAGKNQSWAVDLSDGSARQTHRMRLDDSGAVQPGDGFPGDDVIVYRTGQQLTGADPATGRELWSYTDRGDGFPGIDVANGAVTVLNTLPDRAAALSGIDPHDSPKSLTVLDARTGRATARHVFTGADRGDELWSSYGIGPGQALLMTVSGDTFAIGRR